MRCSVMKGGLLGAAARRQGDSRCVCSDGGAVGGRFAAPWCCGSSGWSNRRSRSTQSTRRGSLTLALFLGEVRCVSGAGLMAAICLPGEVRRPVPGYYAPGGALGVLSVGAGASLRATHCFNRLWISCSSFSWICASQHSSLRKWLHLLGNSCHSSSLYSWAVWRMPLGCADSASSFASANWIWWFMGANAAGSHCWASS